MSDEIALVAHPGTPSERAVAGRNARARAPRASHADWYPAQRRPDPVRILQLQARGRVSELLPLRYGRMRMSPFAFYRGAAAIMAEDLAPTATSGLRVQLCGDAHLSNFGTFESPEREHVFDISDFDETLAGPWEWDVKRLATSVCIAGRERRFSRADVDKAVLQTVAAYRLSMRTFARQGNLEVWYAQLGIDRVAHLPTGSVDSKRLRVLERQFEKLRLQTNVSVLDKLTETVDGAVRFRGAPPDLVPIEELAGAAGARVAEANALALLRDYRAGLREDRRTLLDGYRYAAAARKVVGVGSVGTRVWAILLHGRDGRDPLVLQVKEAGASVLERHLPPPAAATHGGRVVAGQQLMQASSDIFLGAVTARGPDGGTRGRKRDYYVRQLADGKGSLDIEHVTRGELAAYGHLCGRTLALAHARAGDRVAIAGYLGGADGFDRAVTAFAKRYADQNEADHAALVQAIDDGRIQVADG
jgi:uncharacterized protein (DUF2252 family)